MRRGTIEYHSERAQAEREAALKAAHAHARRSHEQMATLHDEKATEARSASVANDHAVPA